MQHVKVGQLRDRIAGYIRLWPSVTDENVALVEHMDLVEGLGYNPTKVVIEFRDLTPEAVESMRTGADRVKQLARRLKGTTPSRGRGSENPDWYRQIAELYLEMLGKHGPCGLIQAIADVLNAKPNTVSQWVRKARLKDWLGPAPSEGRAGGVPGPRLIECWEDHENQEMLDYWKGPNVIIKRGKSWTHSIEEGYEVDENGKRKRIRRWKGGFPTKTAAQEAYAEHVSQLGRGERGEPSRITLGGI